MSVSPLDAQGGTVATTAPSQNELPLPAIFFFLALVVILFLPVLSDLVKQWFNDENMGYAFFVPIVVAYIIWLDKDRIMQAPVKPCWPALFLVAWGFIQMLFGLLGAVSFFSRTAFIVTMAGVVWTIAGTAVIRTLLFPIVLSFFMVPIPLYVYQRMTLPLQSLASNFGAIGLSAIGIPVAQDGNVLTLPDGHSLDVVEACSGIRSLLSLTFLSMAYGRLFETRKWVRIVLLLATVPIAIFCNAARITLTGILTEYKPEIAEGAYHAFEGWVIFMFELMCLLGFHKLLSRRRSDA
ncbi:MAG TPA: exosortase/archaeosortase family protein [Bryobacteraceae bacterium]|jgi:exosortase|nr:exosortase/archaeosortase family protein [Bryobacteraceae bacterium]